MHACDTTASIASATTSLHAHTTQQEANETNTSVVEKKQERARCLCEGAGLEVRVDDVVREEDEETLEEIQTTKGLVFPQRLRERDREKNVAVEHQTSQKKERTNKKLTKYGVKSCRAKLAYR